MKILVVATLLSFGLAPDLFASCIDRFAGNRDPFEEFRFETLGAAEHALRVGLGAEVEVGKFAVRIVEPPERSQALRAIMDFVDEFLGRDILIATGPRDRSYGHFLPIAHHVGSIATDAPPALADIVVSLSILSALEREFQAINARLDDNRELTAIPSEGEKPLSIIMGSTEVGFTVIPAERSEGLEEIILAATHREPLPAPYESRQEINMILVRTLKHSLAQASRTIKGFIDVFGDGQHYSRSFRSVWHLEEVESRLVDLVEQLSDILYIEKNDFP